MYNKYNNMSYNRYNTRQSVARHHDSSQFVPAGQMSAGYPAQNNEENSQPEDHDLHDQFNTMVSQSPQQVQQPNNEDFIVTKQEDDSIEDMVSEDTFAADDQPVDPNSDDNTSQRPHWMKPKLQGVRKITNKERRRRQNESLRRLLSPKNALMVLNEIEKEEKTFTVEPMCATDQYFRRNTSGAFCAALVSGGNSYQGFGENKLAARNAAAEQAVRDLLLKKMNSLIDSASGGDCDGNLPMIQLASFALYKLFSEWESQGHLVPQLRSPLQGSDAASDSASASGGCLPRARNVRTELPAAAASMHPCMLLSHMRPGLVYREVAVEGDYATNIVFVMQIEVDGQVYTGKAFNKREARKAAAREACRVLFDVRFNDELQLTPPSTAGVN